MDNMSGTVMSETEDDDGQLSKKDVSLFFYPFYWWQRFRANVEKKIFMVKNVYSEKPPPQEPQEEE